MIDNFLVDFYSEKTNEQLSQDKFNNIINTYGSDYDSLINDLYSKYDPGNIDDNKLNIIKDTYGLNTQQQVEQPESTPEEVEYDYSELIKSKKADFDKFRFKMAERKAYDKYKETGEIDLALLPKDLLTQEQYQKDVDKNVSFISEALEVFHNIDDVFRNLPTQLRNQVDDFQAFSTDLIGSLAGADASDWLVGDDEIVNQPKKFKDPVTNELIGFEDNPEKWKQLNKLNSTGFEVNESGERVFKEGSRGNIEIYYGDTGVKVGQPTNDYVISQIKQVKERSVDLEEVGELTEGFKKLSKGDMDGISDLFGGGVNAVSAVAQTAIPALFTFGTSLIPQVISPMFTEYNTQKAKNLYPESEDPLQELADNNQIEIGVPTVLGTLAVGLEYLGFRGISKYLLGKSGVMGKGMKLLQTGNKEGTTELTQGGIEQVNKSLAEGKSLSQSVKNGLDFITSQDGVESYLQGFVGGTSVAGVGKNVRIGLRTDESGRKVINESINKLTELNQQLNQTKSEEIKSAIRKDIEDVENGLKDYINTNNQIAELLTEEQKNKVSNLVDEKGDIRKSYNKILNQFNNNEITSKEFGYAKRSLNNRSKAIDSEISKIKQSVNLASIEKQTETIKEKQEELGVKINAFETAKEFAEVTGQDPNVDGFYNPSTSEIFINKEKAAETGAVNVAAHELLHNIIKNEVSDINKAKKLIDDFKNVLSEKELNIVQDRINKNYRFEKNKKGELVEKEESEYIEEYLTAFSDAIGQGDIIYKENIFTKIGDVVSSILRNIGFKKIKFNTGRDVYNFIKDYQKNISKGKISKQALEVSKTLEDVEGDIKMSKTASDKVQEIYNDQGAAGALDIIQEFKPIVNKIVERRREAPGFDRQLLTDEIETGERGILDLIQAYDPKSNVPLAAYINKFLPSRAIEASKRVLGEVFESDISERVDIAEPTTAVQEVEITKKPKAPTNLRRALDIEKGDDLYNKVKDVVAKTFGTRIPEVTDPKFKKTLQDTYATELTNDVKKLMGKPSSDKYKTFLQKYGEQIYDLIPQDILNKSYQDFIVEEKNNLSPTQVDNAISEGLLPADTPRTAGPSLFTKKPYNQEEFVEFHLAPKKGRPASKQTQLAQTIAKELGKDATLEVLEDPKVFERFTEVQEIQGREVTKKTKPKIAEKIQRKPGVKFSISEDIINVRDIFDVEVNGKDKLLELYNLPKTTKIKNEKDIETYIDELKSSVFILGPKEMWFGPGKGTAFTSSSKNLGMSSKNPLWSKFKEEVQKLKNDDTIKYGKPIPGVNTKNIWSLRNKYDKLFKSPEVIKNNIKNGEINKFNKQVSTIHKELWKRINNEISKDKSKVTAIANYLGITANDTGHWHKLGAQFEGYSKDIKGKRYEYEHAMPATAAYLYLLDATLSDVNFETSYDLVIDNYKLIALDKAMDDKLRNARTPNGYSLQRRMPDEWSVINDSWWQRYFNDIVSKQDGGIDPNSIIGLDGKTFSEKLKVDVSGNLTTPELSKSVEKAKNDNIKNLSNKVASFSKSMSNDEVLSFAATLDNSLANARKLDAPVKKIRVFDFDDTLAQTKSIVFYTNTDGTEGQLTAEEFAEKGADLVAQGAVMDFSDFNIVRDGKRGPLFNVAKKIKDARGNEDLFVLTARAPESADAIYEFLKSEGLEFKRENIIGLGNSTGAAKANWIVGKAAEGYNDFYFADDAFGNVQAVQDVLDQIDVKSKVQQAKVKFSKSINEDFNKIIEQKTGIASEKRYSKAKAKVRGAGKGNKKFFIPYSAEDFMGLTYPLLSKGKLGDSQMAWFKEHLLNPYGRAIENLSRDRIQMMQDFRELKKSLEVPKDLRKTNDSGFTNEQAVRVYLFNKMGYDIPGLSKSDLSELVDIINADGKLKAFADQILSVTKGDGYVKPSQEWLSGTITTDLIDLLNTTKRRKYLEQSGYLDNANEIFSEENLNKLEAAYGANYREAVENILARMKSGKNRMFSGSRLSNRVLDYINGSIGTIMFFNTRSAVLQTISSINFLNWSFNNPIRAGKAFANQKQYWKDFKMLMNSDYLTDRRNGLKLNISENEIANAAATAKNRARGAMNYILQKGYLPTQFADSFAIASGGATFYRNRVNDLISKGIDVKQAEQQALSEWKETAEISQQSSDPSKISQQQASDLGRVILAFANTPMQYARIQKRAAQDLINRRGDAKANVSKIIYYGVVQNLIFNALQQAIFAIGFGDDDDEKNEKKYFNTANGMLDSLLRGVGIAGATTAVIKNFLLDVYERSGRKRPEYVDAVYKLLQLSPPISSKISKIRQAAYQFDSKKRRQEVFDKGFSIDNPAYEAAAKVISATTNLPLDRLINKANNIEAAVGEDAETWQRVAMLAGWPEWQIMPKINKSKSEFVKGFKPSKKDMSDYDTMKKLNKAEQIKILEDLGVGNMAIRKAKKEDDRIKLIIKASKEQ